MGILLKQTRAALPALNSISVKSLEKDFKSKMCERCPLKKSLQQAVDGKAQNVCDGFFSLYYFSHLHFQEYNHLG